MAALFGAAHQGQRHPHGFGQFACNGEPEARSAAGAGRGVVDLGEPLEHTGMLRRRDPDACVDEINLDRSSGRFRGRHAQLDSAGVRILDRVIHDVGNNLMQPVVIDVHHRW